MLIPGHHPGSSPGRNTRPTPHGCGRTGGHRAVTAAVPRRKTPRCCRACCAAAGAGGSCRPATPGRKGNSPRYVCARAKQLYGTERGCCSIGGGRLERTILAELFTVLEPACLEATAKALAEAEQHYRRGWPPSSCPSNARGMKRAGPAANTTPSSQRTGWSPHPRLPYADVTSSGVRAAGCIWRRQDVWLL